MKSFLVSIAERHIQSGQCSSAERCPIALALLEAGFKDVAVDCDGARVNQDGIHYELVLPDVAINFIQEFDAHHSVRPITFNLVLLRPGS